MPYVLKPNKLFVKDPNGTGFLPQNVVTDSTTEDAIAAIQEESELQQAAITAKGTATKNSIPNDYTALSNEVSSHFLETGRFEVGAGQNSDVTPGDYTAAIGRNNKTTGSYSAAIGYGDTVAGNHAVSLGMNHTSNGYAAQAQGIGLIANGFAQHVSGAYNVADTGGQGGSDQTKGQYVEIVGNGNGINTRSNARTLDWNGNEVLAGKITANGVNLNDEVGDLKSAVTNGDISYQCDIIGSYIKNNGDEATSGAYRTSDYIPIPKTATEIKIGNSFYLGQTKYYLANPCVFYNENKERISSGTYHGYDYTTETIPNGAKYVRLNQSNPGNAQVNTVCGGVWFLPSLDDVAYDLSQTVITLNGNYTYTGAFTSNGQIINTGIAVKAGSIYTVKIDYTANDFANGQINVFSNGSGGSANYVAVLPDLQQRDFVCGVDGYLCLYNVFGYIGTVNVSLVENISRVNQKMGVTYYVGQYEREKSLTALLLKLKNDKSPKTIIIRGGDYDIFSEYKALQQSGDLLPVPESGYDPATQYVPYNVFIPDNTHIVGEGLVRLNYMPTVSQTSANEAKTLSPINVAGSMTLENVEINCKNGRYCIHDDPVQDPAYNGAIKKYINVRCTKYTNDDANYGTPHNFGCGVSRAMRYEFDNCYFESKSSSSSARTLYFHDRIVVGGITLQEKMSSNIVIKNTVIKSASGNLGIYFGNIGATGLNIHVDIDSCWTNGNIVSADENSTGTTGNNSNSFNIRTLLSKYNSIIIRDSNNPYSPQEFNMG